FILLSVFSTIYFFGQRPNIPRELTNLLDVPYLGRGYSGEETLGGIIRFDKFVLINTTIKDQPVEIYLYINTTTGAIATRTEKRATLRNENFDIDSKDFKLTYMSPKGLVLSFYNRLK